MIISVLILIWGILLIVKPELTWKIKYFLQYLHVMDDNEPSEIYKITARVIGGILIIWGLIGMF